MINVQNLDECCGCEACCNICPRKCIQMELRDGFYYPTVEESSCIQCGLCEKVCPQQSRHTSPTAFENIGFAARIKDESARMKSTSGGIAYLMAKKIIALGGVAYGVVFDDEFQTVLGRVDNLGDIEKLQGSKYPQCRIFNGYSTIKKDLRKGIPVIVCATPCQIYGLSLFLGKKYDNLFLVDLICHGVPSPSIWKNYLEELFPQKNIRQVVFKHKRNGWKRWSVYIRSDDRQQFKERTDDPYMSSYLSGLNVRPSCYSCLFKGKQRASDITIADAWGKPESDAFLNDGKGLSSVIINTQKGYTFFETLEPDIVFHEYSVADLTAGNGAYYLSIKKNILRSAFITELQEKRAIDILRKYSMKTIRGKMSIKITNVLARRYTRNG